MGFSKNVKTPKTILGKCLRNGLVSKIEPIGPKLETRVVIWKRAWKRSRNEWHILEENVETAWKRTGNEVGEDGNERHRFSFPPISQRSKA